MSITPQQAQPTAPTPTEATPTTAPEVAATNAIVEQGAKDKDFLSPKFAALARKEKELRLAQRKLEEERKAWQDQKQASDAGTGQVESWKRRLAQDPYNVMLESGLTSDQVAALMMNQPDPGHQQLTLMQRQMMEIKQAQEEMMKKHEESQTQAYQDALTQITNDVKNLVASDERYETIKAYGRESDVVELIEETYKQDGRLMTNEEAALEIEEYLVEEALKIAQLKKIQARLTPPVAPEMAAAQKTADPAQKNTLTTNTLTNRMGQQTPARPLNARERRERAIMAFQGKLNS